MFLIFAPSASTPEYVEQQRIVENNTTGFEDRDLMTMSLLETGNNVPERAAALREEYGVESGRFTVVLVGKDGGEKFRSGEPVSARDLFGRIDAMPMRRREMRHRRERGA